MRHLTLLVTILLVFSSSNVQSQRFSDFSVLVGGSLTGTQGKIKDLYPMIVNESVFLPTPHEERSMNALGGALWLRLCYSETSFFLETDFSITGNLIPEEPLGSGHFYLNNDQGLEYIIIFDYERTAFSLTPGYFVYQNGTTGLGIYTALGISWGISSGNRVLYRSNQSQFDLGVQQTLQDGFKIRNDFSFIGNVGLEWAFPSALSIEVRYGYLWGIKDLIETQANAFYWQERPRNRSEYHQLSLGVLYKFEDL